ncbi:hypothetical protein FJZ31_30980 [Candidatus Poribacteria bacterium]|nr:hypothetical protein [Candidatus Poribacteria bacterium]
MSDQYTMTIGLNVLRHLGMGLYSNTPAVLSEVVANSWDADATQVIINIDTDRDEITIEDNGTGMTTQDINDKYLMVGYQKRKKEPHFTAKGRAIMGRKGIGKLSVFSIARVVELHTIKNSKKSGFIMRLDEIEQRIESEDTTEYHPTPISPDEINLTQGTRIILKDLKRDTSRTEDFLRRRLARRFSIMEREYDFEVIVNGTPISAKDRDYYDKIEFMWYLGEESEKYASKCDKSLRKKVKLNNEIVVNGEKHKVEGWIATIDEQKNIDEQYNTIVVFARGKLIQEDILKDLKEGGIYSKYLIGEIDADFMDDDNKIDIVTSDRQRVKEDDPRYEVLKKFIRTSLKEIQNSWTNFRREVGTKRAIENPIIKEWYEGLKGDNKKYAERLFGKIESLNLPDKEAKKELYKASILAFEKLVLKDNLSMLERFEDEKDFELLSKVFNGIDELEAVQYYQIVKGRLEVIREFAKIVDTKSKEKVIQKHLFDHLWLLHPSWERASTNQRMEETITKEFADVDAGLTEEEKKGRVDIRYKTAANKHIIIELKKYEVKVETLQLLAQIDKYRRALEKCLNTKFPNQPKLIEIICVLGSAPEPIDDEERNVERLKTANARYITYDTLIQESLASYDEYLKKEKEISRLIDIIEKL